ncbi:MAG: type II toxin-antitoxin system RelE/ParE family toxin [Rhodoferax sp.]|nr:type II toxin-antitoxin system RelE/ParE family toxin [Rhodoferax sp.]
MRVFKTRVFDRWARKTGITDTVLLKAVADIERGLVDADLGNNLFKQRVALPGQGKSGSTRTLLATRFAGELYFLFGFEKTNRDNITQRELGIYQSLASTLVALGNEQIEAALKANELMEVQHEPDD